MSAPLRCERLPLRPRLNTVPLGDCTSNTATISPARCGFQCRSVQLRRQAPLRPLQVLTPVVLGDRAWNSAAISPARRASRFPAPPPPPNPPPPYQTQPPPPTLLLNPVVLGDRALGVTQPGL
jgi:hypothetical protein